MRIAISILMIVTGMAFANGQAPSLKFDQTSVQITGLMLAHRPVGQIGEREWKEILVVLTHEAWMKKIDQSIAGTWVVEGDDLVFKPSFPFSSAETYHVIFEGRTFCEHVSCERSFADEESEWEFSLSPPESPSTTLTSVYPSSEVVPENILRMYVYFSSPMMPGEAYAHIKLLTDDGSVVEKPFLVVDQELWDAERKRFTLLFDPGRIKRTLKSNLELGSPLKEGQHYRLVIDSTWRDIYGNSLQSSIRKEFTAGAAQRTRLSKDHVEVFLPKPHSREDVVLSFDRPVDRVLMTKYVSVMNTATGEVLGAGRMIDDFTWAFTPDQGWIGGNYEVAISPWVEDVCGNNFNNAFDLDLSIDKRITSQEPIKFPFTITIIN